jgi:hypothetical protein
MDAILAALRDGKLRDIGAKVQALNARQKRALSRELQRRLAEAVADRSLSPDHRWLVTALQFLAPPDAAEAVTAALKPATNLKGCCGCTLNRLMRTLGVIRPLQAIPALADVIRDVKNPTHKHLAVVCIEKILEAHDGQARALLRSQATRLRRSLARLQRETATTGAIPPDTPWDQRPGTPNWFNHADRAIKALTRLLARPDPQ